MTGPSLSSGNRGIASLLALTAAMTTFDAFSTLMSSPWTAENVGADAEKARSAREYYRHAVGFSMLNAVAAGMVAGPGIGWFPVIGAAVANVYLVWLYERAIHRAEGTGYTGGWLKGSHAA